MIRRTKVVYKSDEGTLHTSPRQSQPETPEIGMHSQMNQCKCPRKLLIFNRIPSINAHSSPSICVVGNRQQNGALIKCSRAHFSVQAAKQMMGVFVDRCFCARRIFCRLSCARNCSRYFGAAIEILATTFPECVLLIWPICRERCPASGNPVIVSNASPPSVISRMAAYSIKTRIVNWVASL